MPRGGERKAAVLVSLWRGICAPGWCVGVRVDGLCTAGGYVKEGPRGGRPFHQEAGATCSRVEVGVPCLWEEQWGEREISLSECVHSCVCAHASRLRFAGESSIAHEKEPTDQRGKEWSNSRERCI